MSDDTALVNTGDGSNLPTVAGDYHSKFADVPAVFDEIVGSGGFLPRVQFMSAKADICSSGAFPINHFALVRGTTNIDLGEQLDVFVLSYRFKAFDISGDDMIISYDPASETFKDINKRSFAQNSGCMFGPEFLMYVPSQKTFVTFFMGSKSARIESQSIMALLKRDDATNWLTLLPKKIPSKKYAPWWIGTGRACQTEYPIPSPEECERVVDAFDNPPAQQVEKVVEGETSERER